MRNALATADISETYRDFKPIFRPTDGSVTNGKVGCALTVIMADEPHQWRLPDNCSFFRAELFTIEQALKSRK